MMVVSITGVFTLQYQRLHQFCSTSALERMARLVFMISSKSTNITTAEQHSSHTIQVAKEFTIEQLIGWIGLNNLDRYRFTPEGTGCRRWCVEILKRMEGDDIVPTGSTDQFVSFLAAESKVKPSSIPEDTGHGSFY